MSTCFTSDTHRVRSSAPYGTLSTVGATKTNKQTTTKNAMCWAENINLVLHVWCPEVKLQVCKPNQKKKYFLFIYHKVMCHLLTLSPEFSRVVSIYGPQ